MVLFSKGSSVRESPEDKQATVPCAMGSAKISWQVNLALYTGHPLLSTGTRHFQGPPPGGVASARRSTGPPLHQQLTHQGKAPGGGPVRPTGPGRHSSRRPVPSGPRGNVPMPSGPLCMTSSSSKSPGWRAAKRTKPYLTWSNSPAKVGGLLDPWTVRVSGTAETE